MKRQNKIAGLILSAGLSKRMGGKPKALLEYRGKTFLEIVVEKLKSASIKDCFIILGHRADEIKKLSEKKELLNIGCHFIFNQNYIEGGMLSSIITGINEIKGKYDALMLYPVDYPSIKNDTLNGIIKEYELYPDTIISPAYNGRMGHPVLISSDYFDEIIQAPPDKGARVVIHGYEGKPELRIIDTDDKGVRFDIDTPEDYQLLLQETD